MRSLISKTLATGVAALLGLAAFPAEAANHTVTVGSPNPFAFSPANLSIAAGDTVTWTYAGGGTPHNVQSDPGSVTMFRCAQGCDADGGNGAASGTAWTSTVTFPTAGTIGYFCFVHGGAGGAGMAGSITVTVPVDLQSFEID